MTVLTGLDLVPAAGSRPGSGTLALSETRPTGTPGSFAEALRSASPPPTDGSSRPAARSVASSRAPASPLSNRKARHALGKVRTGQTSARQVAMATAHGAGAKPLRPTLVRTTPSAGVRMAARSNASAWAEALPSAAFPGRPREVGQTVLGEGASIRLPSGRSQPQPQPQPKSAALLQERVVSAAIDAKAGAGTVVRGITVDRVPTSVPVRSRGGGQVPPGTVWAADPGRPRTLEDAVAHLARETQIAPRINIPGEAGAGTATTVARLGTGHVGASVPVRGRGSIQISSAGVRAPGSGRQRTLAGSAPRLARNAETGTRTRVADPGGALAPAVPGLVKETRTLSGGADPAQAETVPSPEKTLPASRHLPNAGLRDVVPGGVGRKAGEGTGHPGLRIQGMQRTATGVGTGAQLAAGEAAAGSAPQVPGQAQAVQVPEGAPPPRPPGVEVPQAFTAAQAETARVWAQSADGSWVRAEVRAAGHLVDAHLWSQNPALLLAGREGELRAALAQHDLALRSFGVHTSGHGQASVSREDAGQGGDGETGRSPLRGRALPGGPGSGRAVGDGPVPGNGFDGRA